MQIDASTAGSPENGGSKWPACAMLSYGTFGRQTPAGRRYHVRTGIALGVMVVAWVGSAILAKRVSGTPWLAIQALAPGFGYAFIAWEFRRYLLTLDELGRRIQMESIAWTYLSGLVIATLAGGIAMAYGLNWDRLLLNPLWYVLLEPVRGCFLYYVARRY